jgi:hypothetical protein
MFWMKKKITSNAFKKIEYFGTGWRTVEKQSFSLFGKTYSVHVIAVAKKELNEKINDLQELALTSFTDIIVSKKSEIEEAITNHIKKVSSMDDYKCRYRDGYDLSDIPSRFIPNEIEITRKGECAIFVEDDAEEFGAYDDWDEGFVISVIPEVKIYSKELYSGYVYGGGSLDN